MRSNYSANATAGLEILTEGQCKRVIAGAMEVLERTGVVYHDEESVEIMKKAGCFVEGNRVRVPCRLVERAIHSAPSKVTLNNSRTGTMAMELEGGNGYFGTGSDTPFFFDPYSGARVPASRETVAMAAKVIDALPHIDFMMSLGIVQDVPQLVYDRYQFESMVLNTSKPIVVTAIDNDGYGDIIKMCEIIAGGESELRRHPFMTLYAEPISPLVHSGEAAQKLVLAGKKQLPVVYTPCIMAGSTVPATLAGAMANGLAESLSGLVLNQLTHEGNPFIMGGVFTIMDMRTTIFSYGAPEFDLMMAALGDVSAYLDIPMFGTAGCSDSKLTDEQVAIEYAISIMMSAQSGANLIHDVGYIEHGNAASLESLVIADDLIGYARKLVGGIEVNDDTLALDVIHRVGPGGDFISDKHTFENFKKATWYPDLFRRTMYDKWVDSGSKTLTQRANEKVKSILENHVPEPLPQDVQKSLREIVEKAEKKIVGK
jgi:trimethylamine--corrinoid protein Co-methyltransferase